MDNARTIDSQEKLTIYDVCKPFSNFKFCEKNFKDISTFKRILSQARWNGVKTMVVEKIPLSEELERENQDLIIRTSGYFKEGEAFRISLFSEKIEKENPDNIKNLSDKDFLGYAIIKKNIFKNANNPKYKDQECILFESVTRPPLYHANYILVKNSFKVKIAGNIFTITGIPFFQQNDLTNVCAHSSLRTLISLTKSDYILTPHKINDDLNIDHSKYKMGKGNGLDSSQIKEIIKKNRLRFFDFKYDTNSPKHLENIEKSPYQKILYDSIESGFAGLLGFELTTPKGKKEHHIVPVTGHTFNKDAWVPGAEESYFKIGGTGYIPSESWSDNFIIHDDNFGSYYSLPYRYLELKNIRLCLGILPDKKKSDPIAIEPIALIFLEKILANLRWHEDDLFNQFPWLYRLLKYCSNGRVILRTILMKKSSYIKHLRQMESWEGEKINKKRMDIYSKILPNSFWMVEVSIPELFSANRRKLGELLILDDVVIKPEIQPDWSLFLFAHLPACLAIKNSKQNEFGFYPHSIKSHTPIYSQSEDY